MITLGLPTAAEAIPAALLSAEAGGAAAGPIADFSNVLQQLMGPAPGARPAIDLPLAGDAERGPDQEDVDELVNAIVVDLGAQPVLRLAATTVWAVTETPAPPATQATAADVVGASASAEAGAFAGLVVAAPADAANPMAPAAGADVPDPATRVPVSRFEMLPAAEAGEAGPVPAAAATPLALDGAGAVTEAEATGPSPTPVIAAPAAARPGSKTDRTAAPLPPAETPVSAPVIPAAPAAVPTAPTREIAATPLPASRASDPPDPSRQAIRVTADAGQRAYAAAAAESPGQDAQPGFSEARREPGPELQAGAPAEPRTGLPFHVIAERPAPAVAASPATAVVTAPAMVDAAVAAELPAQVVQSIRMQAIDGGGEAIVRLRPDYLGELVVAVKVENGAVTAALQSDTPAVRKWVESNEATLRQALAEHGLQLDRLTVSDEAPSADTGERDSPDRREQEQQSESQSRRQRKPAPDATFEVIV